MSEAQYRTGQAARILAVSSHHIRRLCEAGMLAAELTAGNRWKIPAAEVDRLKRDGVPPIPQLPESEPRAARRPTALPDEERAERDDCEPNCGLAPEVQAEADNLAIAERRLKRRKLELEQEDVEDSFREREKRRTAERDVERRAIAEENARRRRKQWVDIWILFALGRLKQQFPFAQVPGECSLALHAEVESVLQDLTPEHSEDILTELVDACVRKVVAPFKRREEVERAIEAVLRSLPYPVSAVPQWRAKAKQAATLALSKIGPADYRALVDAATAAVAPITAECLHQKWKEEFIQDCCWDGFWSANEQDREEARELVRIAVDSLPVGTPHEKFRHVRDKAVAPVVAKIRTRKEREQARRNAEATARENLYRVDSYVRENCDLEDFFERIRVTEELKRDLEPVLIGRLADGKLPAARVGAFIEDWLDEQFEDLEDDEEEDEYDEEDD